MESLDLPFGRFFYFVRSEDSGDFKKTNLFKEHRSPLNSDFRARLSVIQI